MPPCGLPRDALALRRRALPCRYYLRHLADTSRFPSHPIVDHVALLQAILAEWRGELARVPLAMSEADACGVLGLAPAAPGGHVTEEELRKAYRAMARK